MEHQPRIRDLGSGVRASLTCLCLVLAGGLAASLQHLVWHHQNRDERPGLSLTDIQGAYHGVRTIAPIRRALDRGHPEGLPTADHDALITWLDGGRIVEDYDNLDLGDMAPAEVLARSCLSCHARARASAEGGGVALEYLDDIRPAASSREINPVDIKVLAMSTHTHALGLGSLSIVVTLLLAWTRWPRRLTGGLAFIAGLALLADLSGWWLARSTPGLAPVIGVAGAAYSASTALALLLIIIDLWRPATRTPRSS